jgi:hypothetical protein
MFHVFDDVSCAQLSLYSSCLHVCDCQSDNSLNSDFRSCYAKMSTLVIIILFRFLVNECYYSDISHLLFVQEQEVEN